MKKICLTITIAVFLLLCINGIQAQTTQTKLNQVELMKQLLGSWKTEVFQDTIVTGEMKSFGNGLEWYSKTEVKGKIVREGKSLIGYDKKNDKLIECNLSNGSPDIILYSMWFTSANKFEEILLKDVSNTENALIMKCEFKSPDLLIENDFVNNKLINTYTIHRVKK
jgi:hypothetical protein